MIELFNTILYQPIFNLFIFLYNNIADVGFVILIITILVRLLLYPMTSKSIKAQRNMQELQPKLEAIKKQFKDDKQKQTQAIMELYKKSKVNPFGSCLPLLLQLPILIALYMVMRNALASTDLAQNLYSFVSNPGTVNSWSLGYFDLAVPSKVLAFMAGAAQYWQARTMSRKQTRKKAPKEAGKGAKDENMMAMMNKQMLYMMPVITVFIGFRLPAGLTLYWFFSTLLMAVQQMILTKQADKEDSDKPSTDGVIEGEVVK